MCFTVCRVQQKSRSKGKTEVTVCMREKERKSFAQFPPLGKEKKSNLIHINQSKRNQNCIRNQDIKISTQKTTKSKAIFRKYQ